MNYPYKYAITDPYMYGMPNTDIAGNPCFTHMSMSALIHMWPDPISCRGVISFSISAPIKKRVWKSLQGSLGFHTYKKCVGYSS